MGFRYRIQFPFEFVKKGSQQIIFWGVSYFTLLTIFSGSDEWERIDFIYTGIFLVTLMVAVGLNLFILRRYLARKRYTWFVALTIVNILASTYFNQLLFDGLIDYVLPGYYFISYYSYFDLLKFFFAFIALTALLSLSREWFRIQETRHQLVVVEKEKANAELKALTNQVNPHFLFNSLTVLYSLSLKDSKETSGAIIRLSDILRYVIYESSAGNVPLRSEVSLIQSYIDLQRYRIHPSTRIEVVANIANEEISVMPMLFLPLIENSFKHGVHGDIANTFVVIRLDSDDRVINFRIVNSVNSNTTETNSQEGIGLKNIKSRLELMYPHRYEFNATRTATEFAVEMKIVIA
jgi:sensor histidine kinase YesM